VDIVQEAALVSRAYFEKMKRYTYLEPVQFTTNLLTRSGRIDYDNLRVRDAGYLDLVDRSFGTSPGDELPLVAPRPILTPFKLREMSLSNRVVAAPLLDNSNDGTLSKDQSAQLNKLATRGAAMILAGPVAISATGRINPRSLGLYQKSHQNAWRKAISTIHQNSRAKIALQLNHAGRRGATRSRKHGLDRPLKEGSWPLLAPSPLPYYGYSQAPKEMNTRDLEKVRDEFVQAAEMAEEAGVDLLQLHFGHGYLLGAFLSPLTNRREDVYGGSLVNRLRYPLEVLGAVRAVWPAEKPLSVALNVTDWARGGLTENEAVTIARELKAAGVDLLEPLAGQTTPVMRPSFGVGFLTPFSELLRHETKIPTLVRGFLTTTGQVNSILAAGRGDLCIMETDRL
jgi:anthraniloyl-CoA monooxygenase